MECSTAIDHDDLAGDEACRVACKEQASTHQILGALLAGDSARRDDVGAHLQGIGTVVLDAWQAATSS